MYHIIAYIYLKKKNILHKKKKVNLKRKKKLIRMQPVSTALTCSCDQHVDPASCHWILG